MNHRRRRLALALGMGAVATGLASLGLATAATEQSTQQAALDRFCANQHPCVIINGAADPSAGDEKARLMTPGEALAASGRGPGACPEARDAYQQSGVDPDAFVGPCPKELPAAGPEGSAP